MSLREKWTFQYTIVDLRAAATGKAEHHRARFKFWSDKRALVMDEVCEKGISVEESVAGSPVSNRSPGYGARIVVDNVLQRRLDECQMKVDEHSAYIKQYDAWAELFSSRPDADTVMLDHDDFHYFFGEK